jgi:hypothetical protein
VKVFNEWLAPDVKCPTSGEYPESALIIGHCCSDSQLAISFIEASLLMLILFSLVQSSSVWNIIPKIASPWNLAAFALAVVLYLMLKKRKGDIPFAAWLVIVLLVAIPVGASVYSGLPAKPSIYRLRVTVTDPQSVPVEDAKVWSSFGGEPKRVAGGWQFDIPEESKPKEGKLTIFASKEDAFLNGQADLTLGNDLNPAVTINLKRNDSAKIRGQIVDSKNRSVVGARVFVIGYEAESVLTKEGGNFELPAHAANDQQVLLHAEKGGLAAKLWHPAGDAPAIIKLGK